MNKAICSKAIAHRNANQTSKNNESFVLQPLFRALLIVVSSKFYNMEDSRNVGTLPVFLVRTGEEEGLSAPVTFKSIASKIVGTNTRHVVKTTLETAIDFVKHLEARETAAFGLRPAPILDSLAWYWPTTLGSNPPAVGPGSQWVDTEIYPEWSGGGKHADDRMADIEKSEFRRHEETWVTVDSCPGVWMMESMVQPGQKILRRSSCPPGPPW